MVPEVVVVYAVIDDALSPDFPLGVELEVFIRREDAERFIEEVRGDDPEMSSRVTEPQAEVRRRGASARSRRSHVPDPFPCDRLHRRS